MPLALASVVFLGSEFLGTRDHIELTQAKIKVMLRPTVVGQSVLVSSTNLGLTTTFSLLSDSCGFVDMGALSDERKGLPFTIAAGPRQRSHSWVGVRRDS
jgi:hypothetical protein